MAHRRWKFGVGQSAKDELAEIKAARCAGLEHEYIEGQRLQRMREAEANRKRRAKIERRQRRQAVEPRRAR